MRNQSRQLGDVGGDAPRLVTGQTSWLAGTFTVTVKPVAKSNEPSPAAPSFTVVCIQASQLGIDGHLLSSN